MSSGSNIYPPIGCNDTFQTAGLALGSVREYNDDLYRYVHLVATSGGITAGDFVFELPATGVGEVTDDVANSKAHQVAGRSVVTITTPDTTNGNYFFVRITGRGVTLNTTGADSIAAGDYLIATTGGLVRAAASVTEAGFTLRACALADADDDNSANTVAATLLLGNSR